MRSANFRLRFAVVFAGSAVAGCIIHDSGGAGSSSVGANQLPASALRPLRQAGAAANRRIGTALMSARLSNAKVRALVAREFDSLTPENEMKWEAIEPQPGPHRGGDGWSRSRPKTAFACAGTRWSGIRSWLWAKG